MPRNTTTEEIKEYESGKRRIDETLAIVNPTLHLCPEWDFMLIDDSDVEFDCCGCFE